MIKTLRIALGALLAFGALNAFGGGVYGLAGARAIPREWLSGSGFSDYFVPGLILVVVVGGALAGAAVALFAGTPRAPLLAMAAGEVVLLWMAFQLSIIGFRSWMQALTIAVAVIAIALAALLGQSAGVMSSGEDFLRGGGLRAGGGGGAGGLARTMRS
jgi:hypothetical protein